MTLRGIIIRDQSPGGRCEITKRITFLLEGRRGTAGSPRRMMEDTNVRVWST